MKPEFKITNIRATSQTRDLTEKNHISMFTLTLKQSEDKPEFSTIITKKFVRRAIPAIILFDIQGKTWWVKEEEFITIKFALENATTDLLIFYREGSSSPLVNQTAGQHTSGRDGYELEIRFK